MSSQASFLLQKVAPLVIREIGPHITSRVTPLITEKIGIPLAKKVGLPIVKRIGIPIARKAGNLFITKVGYPVVNKVVFKNNPNLSLQNIGAMIKTGTVPEPTVVPKETSPLPPVAETTKKKRRSLKEMIIRPKKVKTKSNLKVTPKTNSPINNGAPIPVPTPTHYNSQQPLFQQQQPQQYQHQQLYQNPYGQNTNLFSKRR